jgi:hypothetical protein
LASPRKELAAGRKRSAAFQRRRQLSEHLPSLMFVSPYMSRHIPLHRM